MTTKTASLVAPLDSISDVLANCAVDADSGSVIPTTVLMLVDCESRGRPRPQMSQSNVPLSRSGPLNSIHMRESRSRVRLRLRWPRYAGRPAYEAMHERSSPPDPRSH